MKGSVLTSSVLMVSLCDGQCNNMCVYMYIHMYVHIVYLMCTETSFLPSVHFKCFPCVCVMHKHVGKNTIQKDAILWYYCACVFELYGIFVLTTTVFGDCTIRVSSAIDVLLDSQLADTN